MNLARLSWVFDALAPNATPRQWCWLQFHPSPKWTSCQICKIADYACTANTGNPFPATDFKGSCYLAITLTRRSGENVIGIPGACATGNFTYMARGPWPRALREGLSPALQYWRTDLWCLVYGDTVRITCISMQRNYSLWSGVLTRGITGWCWVESF